MKYPLHFYLILLLFPCLSIAQLTPVKMLTGANITTTITYLRPVDMNLDGRLDLLVDRRNDLDGELFAFTDRQPFWYRNEGNGDFSPVLMELAYFPTAGQNVYDLDEDGDLDLMRFSYYKEGNNDGFIHLEWLENTDGQGTAWEKHVLLAIPDNGLGFGATVTTEDVNNDGVPDFVFQRDLETTIKAILVFPEAGQPQLNNGGSFDIGTTGAETIHLVDKNGDGWNDLLFVIDGAIHWAPSLTATGSAFGTAEPLTPVFCCSWCCSLGRRYFEDLSGDGLADLLVVVDEHLIYLENTGGASFADQDTLFSSAGAASSSILFEDLDDNGYPDLIQSFYAAGEEPFVLFNYGPDMGFSEPIALPITGAPSNAQGEIKAVLDINGDGAPDYLRQTNMPTYPAPTPMPARTEWLLRIADFDEVAPGPMLDMALSNPNKPKFVDIDGDGDKDLLSTGNPYTDIAPKFGEGLGVYENLGEENFVLRSILRVLYDPNAEDAFYGTMFGTAEDMDGDGDKDILCGGDGLIFWAENLDGAFEFAEPEVLVTQPSHIDDWRFAGMDCDQDGDTDLLVKTSGGIRLYYKDDGQPGFSSSAQISGITKSDFIEVGDMDGDGDLDIAYVQRNGIFGGSYVFVQFNLDGLGQSWSSPKQIGGTFASGLDRLQMVNMDQDADLDLLINGWGYDGFNTDERFIWAENISGDFASYISHTLIDNYTLFNFYTPFAVDYTQDGLQDLILSAYESGNFFTRALVLFENQGNNTFDFDEPQVLLSETYEMDMYPLFLEDVDLDGSPDLILTERTTGLNASWKSPGVYWYPNFLERVILSGQVYFDLNGNGQRESDEVGLAHLPIALSPNGLTRYSDNSGNYRFIGLEPEPTFTISYVGNADWQVSSSPNPLEVVNAQGIIEDLDIGLIPTDTIIKGTLEVATINERCNQTLLLFADAQNRGNASADATVTIVLDPKSPYLLADPLPSSINGDTLQFELAGILPTQGQLIKIRAQMPDETYVDSTFTYQGTIDWLDASGQVADEDSEGVFLAGLSCGVDPNDKLMTPDRGEPAHYILYEDTLEYTVRFQNTGNDTAFRVRIVDVLDPNLDLNTFELLSASHPYEVELDLNNRRATWLFPDIHLPDSTTNLLESQGYIKYRVQPKQDTPEGTMIENRADIFFDLNAPILTNTVLNTLVEELPVDTCALDLTIFVEPDDPDMIYCPGDIVLFSAPTGLDNYQWHLSFSNDPDAGMPIPGAEGSNIAVDVSQVGFGYFFLIAEDDGCIDTSELQLVDSWNFLFPVIASTGENEFCSGDSLPIWYPSAGAASYQWYLDGNPIPGANDSLYWVQQAGTYILEVSYEECPNFFQNSGVGPTFEELTPIPTEIIMDPGMGMNELSASTGTVVQWYLDGEAISGATNATYLAVESGSYQVEVLDNQGCTVLSDPLDIIIESVDEIGADAAVRLYPNPAQDWLRMESASAGLQHLRMLDITGRVVLEAALGGQLYEELDLSTLPSGTFICRITLEDRRLYVARLIRLE